MVWLLLCKEYKLHMGNRLVDSFIFSPSRVHRKSKGKKLMEMEWREIQLFILFLCVLSKFSYKHISLIYIIFLIAIFIWEIQIFSWGRYLKKTNTIGQSHKRCVPLKIMWIFWSHVLFCCYQNAAHHVVRFLCILRFPFAIGHSCIQFCPSPSAVSVGGCSETCKEPMGKLLIARSRQ